jgi:hypothetical protein
VQGDIALITDDRAGLYVVDVLDPTVPELVTGFYTTDDALAVAITGDHAVVAARSAGIEIINIPSLLATRVVATLPGPTYGVATRGTHAYLAGGEAGLQVVDVADPTAPLVVGSLPTTGEIRRVALGEGAIAFVKDTAAGVLVVDVADPTSPAVVCTLESIGSFDDLVVENGFAYVASGSGPSAMQVLDFSSPAAPSLIGGLDQGVRGLAVADDLVYLAAGEQGLQIYPVQCDLPVPGEGVRLEAIRTAEGLVITWRLGGSQSYLGFHLYRASEGSRAFEPLNDRPIRATADRRRIFEFVDRTVVSGQSYVYRLEAVRMDGEAEILAEYAYSVGGTAPRHLALHQNHPNPFNPATSIRFDLPETAHVKLRIYDVGGRLVRSLVDENLIPESYALIWDGRDEQSREVGSGVYFYRLDVGDRVLTRRLVLIR